LVGSTTVSISSSNGRFGGCAMVSLSGVATKFSAVPFLGLCLPALALAHAAAGGARDGGWSQRAGGLLVAGLAGDQRDGCPIEPIATESVNASPLVRAASARAFTGWCVAIEERLSSEGWSDNDVETVALAVISLIEGALILSRIAGDPAALSAAKPAARSLLRA